MTLSLCNCYRVFKLKPKAIILPWLDYFRCVIVERVQQTYNSPIESLNLFRGGQKKMHQNQWINPTTVLSLLSNCLVPFSLRLSLRGKTSHSKLIIERNITWIYGQNSTVWSLKWRFFCRHSLNTSVRYWGLHWLQSWSARYYYYSKRGPGCQ